MLFKPSSKSFFSAIEFVINLLNRIISLYTADVYKRQALSCSCKAEALHLELDQVNLKATTEEGLGFTGTGAGISSQAVCLIDKPEFYMDGTIGCGGCGGCKN